MTREELDAAEQAAFDDLTWACDGYPYPHVDRRAFDHAAGIKEIQAAHEAWLTARKEVEDGAAP